MSEEALELPSRYNDPDRDFDLEAPLPWPVPAAATASVDDLHRQLAAKQVAQSITIISNGHSIAAQPDGSGPPLVFGATVGNDEDRCTEFKAVNQTKHPIETIVRLTREYVCAFLNSTGGTIYFGIHDAGVVLGLPLTAGQRLRLTENIRLAISSFSPMVLPDLVQTGFFPVILPSDLAAIVDGHNLSYIPAPPMGPKQAAVFGFKEKRNSNTLTSTGGSYNYQKSSNARLPPPLPLPSSAHQRFVVAVRVVSGGPAPVYFTGSDRLHAYVRRDGGNALMTADAVYRRMAGAAAGLGGPSFSPLVETGHSDLPDLIGMKSVIQNIEQFLDNGHGYRPKTPLASPSTTCAPSPLPLIEPSDSHTEEIFSHFSHPPPSPAPACVSAAAPVLDSAMATARLDAMREREPSHVSLIALAGLPGTGKTRLATYIAAQHRRHYPDYIYRLAMDWDESRQIATLGSELASTPSLKPDIPSLLACQREVVRLAAATEMPWLWAGQGMQDEDAVELFASCTVESPRLGAGALGAGAGAGAENQVREDYSMHIAWSEGDYSVEAFSSDDALSPEVFSPARSPPLSTTPPPPYLAAAAPTVKESYACPYRLPKRNWYRSLPIDPSATPSADSCPSQDSLENVPVTGIALTAQAPVPTSRRQDRIAVSDDNFVSGALGLLGLGEGAAGGAVKPLLGDLGAGNAERLEQAYQGVFNGRCGILIIDSVGERARALVPALIPRGSNVLVIVTGRHYCPFTADELHLPHERVSILNERCPTLSRRQGAALAQHFIPTLSDDEAGRLATLCGHSNAAIQHACGVLRLCDAVPATHLIHDLEGIGFAQRMQQLHNPIPGIVEQLPAELMRALVAGSICEETFTALQFSLILQTSVEDAQHLLERLGTQCMAREAEAGAGAGAGVEARFAIPRCVRTVVVEWVTNHASEVTEGQTWSDLLWNCRMRHAVYLTALVDFIASAVQTLLALATSGGGTCNPEMAKQLAQYINVVFASGAETQFSASAFLESVATTATAYHTTAGPTPAPAPPPAPPGSKPCDPIPPIPPTRTFKVRGDRVYGVQRLSEQGPELFPLFDGAALERGGVAFDLLQQLFALWDKEHENCEAVIAYASKNWEPKLVQLAVQIARRLVESPLIIHLPRTTVKNFRRFFAGKVMDNNDDDSWTAI